MTTPHDLKTAGLKATLPRLKIINLFEQSKVRHLTAEDVYKKLLAEGLDVGLATVYRVLTQFEQAGLLVRHHFETGKAVRARIRHRRARAVSVRRMRQDQLPLSQGRRAALVG